MNSSKVVTFCESKSFGSSTQVELPNMNCRSFSGGSCSCSGCFSSNSSSMGSTGLSMLRSLSLCYKKGEDVNKTRKDIDLVFRRGIPRFFHIGRVVL